MEANVFNKDEFIKSVKENVKNLYRKTLDEASQQEIFQAVSYTVKDVSNASGSRSVHAPSLPKRTYRCSEDYNRSQEKRRPKQNKVSSPETNPI